MLRPFLLALLLTFAFTTLSIHAQDEAAPWPPDPDEIFAEGVEVVDVEMVEAVSSQATPALDPQIVCDDQLKAPAGEGEWRFVGNPEDNRTYLCFTETGQMTKTPLPEVFDDLDFMNNSPAFSHISPDGNWLLMGFFRFYSYNLSTDEIIDVGRIPLPERPGVFYDTPSFRQWVSNTKGIITFGTYSESSSDQFYAFDVTQTGSLEMIVSSWADTDLETPAFENVQTTAFIQYKLGVVSEHIPCKFILYDAEIQGKQTYDLGYDCLSARLIRTGNSYYFLRTQTEMTNFSELMRLNIHTNELHTLSMGEYERILSVSPKGRYVALVSDGNQLIDLVNHYNFLEPNYSELDNPKLVIFDIEQGIIYRTEGFGGGTIEWISENTIFLNLKNAFLGSFYDDMDMNQSVRLVTFNDTGFKEITIDDAKALISVGLSPDRRFILAQKTSATTIDVFDLDIGSSMPLIYSQAFDLYRIKLDWLENNLLQVKLEQRDSFGVYAIYTIRIPQLEDQTD
jgi:hypothetical protein